MEHKLKIWPEHYQAVLEGVKRAEFRADDREPRFEEGDTLILQPWDPEVRMYLNRPDLSCKVSHVARGGVIPPGWAMLSLEDPPAVVQQRAFAFQVKCSGCGVPDTDECLPGCKTYSGGSADA